MTTSQILLVGYYGKGNFGDDVLLKVTHELVKQAKPSAHVRVIVDGYHGGYVSVMLGGVEILPPARHGHVDMIIHGGGGVFFDFQRHSVSQQLLENVIRAIGLRTYVRAEKFLRKMVGKPRTSTSVRLGMGIGVGTYSKGSPRWRASLPIIADFKALWVRDAESNINLRRFDPLMQGAFIAGSDLAFLTQHWAPDRDVTRMASDRPRLGVILRDWAEEKGGTSLAALADILARLSQEYEITGFVFDQHADPKIRQLLLPYATIVWRPEAMQMHEFSAQLAKQDVLLTSRAHGAICGACLGVPSVIVAIEPKLMQVAAMLPHACCVVNAQDTGPWPNALRKARTIDAAFIAADVAKNRTLSEAAFQAIRGYFA